HAEPDAAVAARDDRHVAFEIEHSAPPPSRLRVAAIILRRDTPARIAVVLLLVEHHDVVHLLTLGVRAFHRDRHRLPVLRDDPSEGLSDLPALLVRAVCRPRVDSLERHPVGDLGPSERVVLAVELRRVLARRARPVRVDEFSRHFLPLTRELDVQRQTLWRRAGTELGLRHIELPRADSWIARLGRRFATSAARAAPRARTTPRVNGRQGERIVPLLPTSELQPDVGRLTWVG